MYSFNADKLGCVLLVKGSSIDFIDVIQKNEQFSKLKIWRWRQLFKLITSVIAFYDCPNRTAPLYMYVIVVSGQLRQINHF